MVLKYKTRINKISGSYYLLIPAILRNDSVFLKIFDDLIEKVNEVKLPNYVELELLLDEERKCLIFKKL